MEWNECHRIQDFTLSVCFIYLLFIYLRICTSSTSAKTIGHKSPTRFEHQTILILKAIDGLPQTVTLQNVIITVKCNTDAKCNNINGNVIKHWMQNVHILTFQCKM